MNNKLQVHSSARNRHHPHHQPFQFSLTNTQQLSVTALTYSNSAKSPRFINLQNLPDKQEVYPKISEFVQQPLGMQRHSCNRRDCVDRKFQVIRKLNRSAPNVKIVSPRKVDIILESSYMLEETKREPSIHSVKMLSHKHSGEKDLLKEFKQLEEIRKELKSRNYLKSKTVNLSVNTLKNSKIPNEQNPQKSNLYLEVKTRISRRYNNMFRKYADGYREVLKKDKQFLKDLCSAHRISNPKLVQVQSP